MSPPGTFGEARIVSEELTSKSPEIIGASVRAGDRGRTGDVQLGKLAFYR
jgi:hypothetical protein